MLEGILRHAPPLVVRLALEHVATVQGAHRIYAAEQTGLCRGDVLRAAERRIAELEGNQAKSNKPKLIVTGQAIEKPSSRIVEAVGRSTRRHWIWLLALLLSSTAQAKPPSAQCVAQCEPGYVAECVAAATPSPTAAPPTPTRTATTAPTATRTATPVPTAPPPTAAPTVPPSAYMGWGATTPGGSGKPIVHVTNLNDSGTGSLRSALSAGNRTVVFDVGGTINLASYLSVNGDFITIDGSTAPAPGITIKNYDTRIFGHHDIILQHVRFRGIASGVTADNLTIKNGSYNIVVDHVSADRATDGGIDISRNCYNVTVQNTILSNIDKTQLVTTTDGPTGDVHHVSLHHNLYINGLSRNPKIMWDESSVAPQTMADVRNNVIWNWRDGYGSQWGCGSTGNDVSNYYWSGSTSAERKANGIEVGACSSSATPSLYTAGNVSGDDSSENLNAKGTRSTPFTDAPPISETDACTAARYVKANAGARPLDSIDQALINSLTLPGC